VQQSLKRNGQNLEGSLEQLVKVCALRKLFSSQQVILMWFAMWLERRWFQQDCDYVCAGRENTRFKQHHCQMGKRYLHGHRVSWCSLPFLLSVTGLEGLGGDKWKQASDMSSRRPSPSKDAGSPSLRYILLPHALLWVCAARPATR